MLNKNCNVYTKVYREASIFYFYDVPSFSKIFKPTGQNQKIGKQCFLPPSSFKISLRDTSFYISLNSLGFYLSRMVVKFSLTCIFQLLWEKLFNLWCSHSQIYAFLLMPQSSTQNSWQNFLFPQRQKGWEEAIICSIKMQSENIGITWNISLFPFVMIAIFLNVMALQFWK